MIRVLVNFFFVQIEGIIPIQLFPNGVCILPEEGDTALGGSSHGTVVINGVLSGDVVLQEQALGVFFLLGVPLASILQKTHTYTHDDNEPTESKFPVCVTQKSDE